MTETSAAQTWMRSLLAADTSLIALLGTPVTGYTHSIYDSVAPQTADFPYLIMELVRPGLDHIKLQMATTVMTNLRFFVKAVFEDAKTARANEAADKIAAALKEKEVNQNGYGMNVFQIEPFSYPEDDGGKIFQHAGAIYEVIVRPETL